MRKTILAVLSLVPSLALASGYSLPNTNPRDLSMCASAVAAQRDSGATFALPAALARLRGPSVSLGGGGVNVFNDWKDPTPGATTPPPAEPATSKLATQTTAVPNVSAAWGGTLPFLGDRGWGVGASVQPFGGAIVKWPQDWAGRYRVTGVDRKVFSAVLGAGVELHPQVRIGGGVIYYRTTETFDLAAWMQPYPNPAAPTAAPDARAHLDLTGHAWSYDASLEVDPLRGVPLTFAVDYKHKATQDLDGSVSWTGTGPYFSGFPYAGPLAGFNPLAGLFGATGAKQQLTIPNVLNVAVAYRVVKPLLLTGTFTFDRWVVYGQDLFNLNTGAPFPVARSYRNGQTYRAGAEYDLTSMVQVRVGVQRDVSGLRSSTYSPSLPDASSWAGSVGASLWFARAFHVDAALFYAKMDEVKASSVGLEPGYAGATPVPVPTGTFRGTYSPSAMVYTLALGWTPGAAR